MTFFLISVSVDNKSMIYIELVEFNAYIDNDENPLNFLCINAFHNDLFDICF